MNTKKIPLSETGIALVWESHLVQRQKMVLSRDLKSLSKVTEDNSEPLTQSCSREENRNG
jgi:hypothetical protein